MRKNIILSILPALLIVIIDQITKAVIAGAIRFHESIEVIDGLFNLVHVRNRGMAFGLMNRPDVNLGFYILVAATIIAVILLAYWLSTLKSGENSLRFGLSLILGGAIGNLIDRIRLGEVIDFLDFYINTYHWPSFNVADSAITVGTVFVALNLLIYGTTENKADE
ncbi:signal peptidase II [Thermodesulfobacteriota bacterium]